MKDFSFLKGQQRVDLFNKKPKPTMTDENVSADNFGGAPPEIEKKRSHRRRRIKRTPRRGRDYR